MLTIYHEEAGWDRLTPEQQAEILPKLADGSCPQWCPATHFLVAGARRA